MTPARQPPVAGTTGMWFGPAERPLAGWWTAPERGSGSGVVIAQPLGYEYWSCHRSMRTLAESLARAGWHALRFDWDGTGDSAGDPDDPGRLAAWRASLRHAVEAMRGAGIERVALAGVRLGATLALLDAAGLGVDEVVACAPVASGKRFVKELKLLGIPDPGQTGQTMYAGLVVDPTAAGELAGVDLSRAAPPAVRRTLLVERSPAAGERLRATLAADGRDISSQTCAELHRMLDVPSEDATVPPGLVAPIVAWLGEPGAGRQEVSPAGTGSTTMPWQGDSLREDFVDVGGLAAVASRSTGETARDVAVVFLNSGSEPHVGPGRAWVDYARALALHGYACFRTDFRGWGESPDDGHAPGRPYDAHCVADALRIVSALRRQHAQVVLAGLCASAWVALRAALQTPVDGVFALNPQLYWRPGDPVEALMSDTHRRRTQARAREARGARNGWWSLLDAVGVRPMASRWLIALRKHRTPVMLSFAEGDDGLTYLHDRCGRRLARELRSGYLQVEEVAGIDHQMYRLWRRPAIVEQLLRFLEMLPAAGAGTGR